MKMDALNNKPVRNENEVAQESTFPYQRLFEAARDGIVLMDGNTGRISAVNRAFAEMAGYAPEELEERPLWETGPMQATDAVLVAFRELRTSDHIYYDELPLVRKNGDRLSVELTCTALRVGEANLIQCIFRDITRRKQIEEELWKSEARFKALFRSAPIGIAIVDADGLIIENNRSLELMVGCREKELQGRHFSSFSHPDDLAADVAFFRDLLEGKRDSYHIATRIIRKDGGMAWGLCGAALIRGPKQDVQFVALMIEDITERKQAEDVIIRSRDFYRSLMNELPNPIRLADTDGNCDYFNRAWLDYAGRRVEQELGDGWALGIHPEDGERVRKLFREALANRSPFVTEYRLRRSDGQYRWLVEFGNPFNGIDGKFAGYISSCYDINERRALEETLKSISLTDDLTGLLNRRGFFTLAQQQIKIANRTKRELLLVYGDLDGFKKINDTFGHSEGDLVLVEISAILREVFRESDLISRLGGDEFAVLMTEDTGRTDENAIVGRLQEAIFSRNMRSPGRPPLSLSVGIQRYDPERPCSLDNLITLADTLMYDNKKSKKLLSPGPGG